MSTFVHGVGVNDANYVVNPMVNGKKIHCPFYKAWTNMLRRCYDANLHSKYPTYKGCSVTEEWYSFSEFKSWMEQQDWKDKHLDKDVLIEGNKLYSQSACAFVSAGLNNFLTSNTSDRGQWPIGVSCHKRDKSFRAKCQNPFNGKCEHLGCFDTPEEAHEAWRKRKHELACIYADQQTDQRIANALRTRFAPEVSND